MKSGMSSMARLVAMTCMATGALRASALLTHTARVVARGSTSSSSLLRLSGTGELSRSALNSSLSEGSGASSLSDLASGTSSLNDLSFLHLVTHADNVSALEMSAGVAAGAGELPSTPLDAAVIAMMRKGTPAFETFLPDCLAHTKRIAHAMDLASPQSQTVPTLEHECLGETPFKVVADNDEQRSACHDFAVHLVAARQEETRSGSQEGYQAFCAYFYGLKYFGAKQVELKPSEKKELTVLTLLVVSGLIAIAVLATLQKQAEAMRYASSPSDQLARGGRRSRVPEQPKHCRWLVSGEEPESERPEEA